jgi:hypothetical protein
VNVRLAQLLAGALVVAGAGMASVVSAQPAVAAPPPGVTCPGGKVLNANGGVLVDLVADSTAKGRVGCTEAYTVIDEYVKGAPANGSGDLMVDGWACRREPAGGTFENVCEKNGLRFHTTPA